MILYIDTSTSICRLWLNEEYFERDLGRDMARLSLGFLKSELESKNLKYGDISGIVVFSGPGSFTGLRIGATIANSLADALNVPIVGSLNHDDLPSIESDEWRKNGLSKLNRGLNDRIATPFYGRKARITKPRK